MIISASIVTYNTDYNELLKCIDSMHKNGITHIYISDNSPNGELKTLYSNTDRIIYLNNNGNIGYGAAHNVAIRKAQEIGSDYHLVINSDVYFNEGIIQRIVDYMERNKDVGQLIPNTIYPDGELQYVVRLLPTPIDLIFRRFLPDSFSTKINNKLLLKFWDHKKPLNIPFHMGCFMFLRMKAIEDVGMFDEDIFMYTEDIDLTRRIHKRYKTMFWPEVTIIHAHKRGSYKNKKLLTIHIKSAIKYFNKWGWIFDKERKQWNHSILKELEYNKK